MTRRRYREDGQRLVRLQSGITVRRPQATPVHDNPWHEGLRVARDVVAGLLVVAAAIVWFAIFAAVQP